MKEEMLTPWEFSVPETFSRKLFRKRILPIGSINYGGRKIDFTTDYLKQMVDSFNDGAFDNVPLQLADAQNQHTNDPRQYSGDVVNMELGNDGLYVTVATTDEGSHILSANPKIGISARIVNDYDRADGKHYAAAVQHALVTHDPRIPGLGKWETVESYSNSESYAKLDLTTLNFTKEPIVADNQLSNEELASLRALLSKKDEPKTAPDAAVEDELTDAELDALLEAVEAEDAPVDAETDPEPVEGEEKVPVTASLSNETSEETVELSNQLKTHKAELAKVRKELDEQRWARERAMFVKDYNLPPSVMDLAKPVLQGESKVIEMSNGDNVDAGAVMRQVLTEVGKLVKLLDLSNELGSSVDGETEDVSTQRNEATKAIRAQLSL